MKTQITEISSTQKEIKIEIPADVVKESYNKVSKKYASGASVPGFRKGNAPLDVVRVRYRDEIKNEVFQQLLPSAVSDAIEEHDLHPLTEPQLHLDDAENVKVNGSQPITFHVHVEVMPEIPTPEYKNLEMTRRVRPVEDAQVEDFISNRLGEQAALIPVENRKSQAGDTIIVDLEGTFTDEPDTEPIKADDLEIALGDDSIEKSFTENLVDLGEDEEKEFTVSYPEDFSSPVLAGKTVNYKAKVKSVGKMETPELTDEWAQSLDEGYQTVADLRAKVREDLEKYSQSDADARLRNDAIAKFIENHEFEIPSALIESQARNLLNNFAQDMQGRGIDLNAVDKEFVQMAYRQMQGQAERDVRGALLLEKVAELENVEVSDTEVDEEVQKMADYYRVSPDEIKTSLASQGGTDNIKNNLRTRKAIESLITHANVTDGEWIDETATPNADMDETAEITTENSADENSGEQTKPAKTKKAAKKAETTDETPAAEDQAEEKETKKKSAKSKK